MTACSSVCTRPRNHNLTRPLSVGFFDNDFVGASKAEVFGRYLGNAVSELSIVDFGDTAELLER